MSNAYEQYQCLKARVDVFGQAIGQRYPTQITCHAGCDGCCYQQFTVFPVEAHHLAQAVTALAPSTAHLSHPRFSGRKHDDRAS